MSQHSRFILKPMSDLLIEALSAISTIGDGIESVPVSDYILQSVFLRMTGFQEQKLKCIVWDLATIDYVYRFERFSKRPVGECSCYDEKNIIYKDLYRMLSDKGVEISDDIRNDIFEQAKEKIIEICSKSNLRKWYSLQYVEFESYLTEISSLCIMTEEHLFKQASNCTNKEKDGKQWRCTHGLCMQKVFEQAVYQFRNQCAHYTQSYQNNLPTLKTLASPYYRYCNYFVRFFMLVLIDEIFRYLYVTYCKQG